MKRKFITSLIIISCITAMAFTGCGKNNMDNNTGTGEEVISELPTDGEGESSILDNEETTEDTQDDNIEDKKEDEENSEETETTDTEGEDTDGSEEKKEDAEVADGEETTNTDGSSSDVGTAGGSSSGSSSGSSASTESTSGSGSTGNGAGTNTTPATPATTHTHSYNVTITTTANCTRTGIRTYTCSCGDAYTETIPVTAHTYSYGKCTVCNASDPSYVETYTYEVVIDTAMLELVNARRTSLGYGVLTWDSSMDEVAKIRARQLADDFRHTYEYPYSEVITCSGRYMSTSDCHTNYVNSSGHDNELHKSSYAYLSSATCYKKDSAGNVVATYNIALIRHDNSGGGSTSMGGEPNPNPPSEDDIIW